MHTGVVLLSVLVAGCHFEVPAVAVDEPVDASSGEPDLFESMPDAAHAPDLAKPFAPSHLPPGQAPMGSGALSGVTQIDTSSLMVTLKSGGALPAGVSITRINGSGYVILAAGTWLVDQDVKVTGSAPLVVVATGDVNVTATIHAEATLDQPGPSGSAPELGNGAGKRGVASGNIGGDDSGGGGGSFGAAGGNGGKAGNTAGGVAGMINGGTSADFLGGSGGGNGGHFEACTAPAGVGGAGGGAIQISSATSISVSGAINAGGGGGHAGCRSGLTTTAGAGGGSGGTIFLEAPMLSVTGKLSANGGGGGGGEQGLTSDATNGENSSDTTAKGGSGSGGGGNGGDGYCDPSISGGNGVDATNAGGGGGGGGRTWLRAHGTPDASTAKISPPAGVLTNL